MEENNDMLIDEEKEPTIKLDNLKELIDEAKDKYVDEAKDRTDNKPKIEGNKFVMSDEEDSFEQTKEIKEVEEKEIVPEKQEEKEEIVEHKVVNDDYKREEVVRETEKKKINKSLIITIVSVVVIVAITVVTLVAVTNKDKKTTTATKNNTKTNGYVSTIEYSIEVGTFDKEIKKSLKLAGVEADKVKLISLDIDSDKQQELVAYAEDDTKKVIIYFEIDEDVYYEDILQVDSSHSLGYAYSLADKEAYYYTENNGLYSILGYTKTVVKEEDFQNKYYVITKDYKEKPFLDNSITYNFDKKLDAKALDKNKITASDILEDKDTSLLKINEEANKYIEEKEEAKRQQEEEERKKKEEEAAANKALKVLELNGNNLHYGKYLPAKKGDIEKLTLNEDGTGTINDSPCTWKETTKELVSNEDIPVLTFTCNDKTYNLTAFNNDSLSDGANIDLNFEE